VNAGENADNIRAAEEKCIRAALKHGVRPRAEITTPEAARRYIELGVKDFNISGEIWNLAAMWNNQGKGVRDILAEGV